MMHSMQSVRLRNSVATLAILLCIAWCSQLLSAESAIGRLSGFDLGRIAALSAWCEKPLPESTAESSTESPATDDGKAGNEVAKFLYQVRRFSRGGLNTDTIPPIDEPTLDVGALAKLSGEVIDLQSWTIPAEMAEPLEMSAVYRVTIKTNDGQGSASS